MTVDLDLYVNPPLNVIAHVVKSLSTGIPGGRFHFRGAGWILILGNKILKGQIDFL